MTEYVFGTEAGRGLLLLLMVGGSVFAVVWSVRLYKRREIWGGTMALTIPLLAILAGWWVYGTGLAIAFGHGAVRVHYFWPRDDVRFATGDLVAVGVHQSIARSRSVSLNLTLRDGRWLTLTGTSSEKKSIEELASRLRAEAGVP